MKTCFKLEDIKLEQDSRKLFTVTYGLEKKKNLTYAEACSELGECIFHNLACDGFLDNTGK